MRRNERKMTRQSNTVALTRIRNYDNKWPVANSGRRTTLRESTFFFNFYARLVQKVKEKIKNAHNTRLCCSSNNQSNDNQCLFFFFVPWNMRSFVMFNLFRFPPRNCGHCLMIRSITMTTISLKRTRVEVWAKFVICVQLAVRQGHAEEEANFGVEWSALFTLNWNRRERGGNMKMLNKWSCVLVSKVNETTQRKLAQWRGLLKAANASLLRNGERKRERGCWCQQFLLGVKFNRQIVPLPIWRLYHRKALHTSLCSLFGRKRRVWKANLCALA